MTPPCVGCFEGDASGQAGRVDAAGLAHAFFHHSPAAALARTGGGKPATGAQAWLTGAALGALGRFGAASTVLTAVAAAGGIAGSLAWSTLASHQRQLGRHAEALDYDQRAAEAVPTRADAGDEQLAGLVGAARFDAELGLTADAVGLGRVDEAVARLAAIDAGRDDSGPLTADPLSADPVTAGWRRRVRHGWVATEIALLRDDPATAVELAEIALAEAIKANAPRHVAKCTLFLGASRYVQYRVHGVSEAPNVRKALLNRNELQAIARRTLQDAVGAARKVEALPLLWVAESLLAELSPATGPNSAAGYRRAAATVVTAIGADLPAEQRTAWLGRPDLRLLLAAGPAFGR